jgi:hypothetical protein
VSVLLAPHAPMLPPAKPVRLGQPQSSTG